MELIKGRVSRELNITNHKFTEISKPIKNPFEPYEDTNCINHSNKDQFTSSSTEESDTFVTQNASINCMKHQNQLILMNSPEYSGMDRNILNEKCNEFIKNSMKCRASNRSEILNNISIKKLGTTLDKTNKELSLIASKIETKTSRTKVSGKIRKSNIIWVDSSHRVGSSAS